MSYRFGWLDRAISFAACWLVICLAAIELLRERIHHLPGDAIYALWRMKMQAEAVRV